MTDTTDKNDTSKWVDEYWHKCLKENPPPPVNASTHYEQVARKHGLPQGLIDAINNRCELNGWPHDLFEAVAKSTTGEFWKSGEDVCNGNVGSLMDLHWTLCEAGKDVFKDHITQESKDRQNDILGSIRNLKKQLSREPEGLNMGLLTLLSFSGGNQYRHVLGERARRSYDDSTEEAIAERDARAQRIVALTSSPTVDDLLDLLQMAVEKNFDPRTDMMVPDTRNRPGFINGDENQNMAQLRWMMQQIIEWYLCHIKKLPKSLIIETASSVFEKRVCSVTEWNIPELYKSALRTAKKPRSTREIK